MKVLTAGRHAACGIAIGPPYLHVKRTFDGWNDLGKIVKFDGGTSLPLKVQSIRNLCSLRNESIDSRQACSITVCSHNLDVLERLEPLFKLQLAAERRLPISAPYAQSDS